MLQTVQGQSGELRKGYKVAVRLGPWTLHYADKRISAEVLDAQPHLLDQEDLDTLARVQVGRGTWEWRAVRADVSGTSATVWVEGDPTIRE